VHAQAHGTRDRLESALLEHGARFSGRHDNLLRRYTGKDRDG
jgi:hypothetical protein